MNTRGPSEACGLAEMQAHHTRHPSDPQTAKHGDIAGADDPVLPRPYAGIAGPKRKELRRGSPLPKVTKSMAGSGGPKRLSP
eukprot:7721656-Alexandrium_andersonii.AAC.1